MKTRIALPFLLLLAACGGGVVAGEDGGSGLKMAEIGQSCDSYMVRGCTNDRDYTIECGTLEDGGYAWYRLGDCASQSKQCKPAALADGGEGPVGCF